jgi:hypothetical protein
MIEPVIPNHIGSTRKVFANNTCDLLRGQFLTFALAYQMIVELFHFFMNVVKKERSNWLSRKCRHFSSLPKVTFEDISPCLPDTSARHTNMLPTSCGVGLLFVSRILCRVVDCRHVIEMSSFELEGAYVTHIPYVCFYICTWVLAGKISVGYSRHKRPRHLKSCVGDTDPSG